MEKRKARRDFKIKEEMQDTHVCELFVSTHEASVPGISFPNGGKQTIQKKKIIIVKTITIMVLGQQTVVLNWSLFIMGERSLLS